jgi:beta-N-acetylhexosaminidase
MIDPSTVGELFVLGFRGTTVPPWLRDFAAAHGLGGAILFDYDVASRRTGRNVQDPAQLRALCAELAALPSRPLVLVDQEGGKVRRLKEAHGFAPLPSARAFNGLPLAERRALARAAYAELSALGIDCNLAPVIDLDLNPHNPDIGAVERAYSADPAEVRGNALLLAEAAREAGLLLCLKHYPGLGGARSNSHEALTDLSACLDERQLALFHELAPQMPGHAVLVSHGIVTQWEPGVPVSLSPVALGALRRRLPDVLLISDDLQMQGLQRSLPAAASATAASPTGEACRRGIAAGLDLLLIGNNLLDEADQAPRFAQRLAQASGEDPALAQQAGAALARVRARKAARPRPGERPTRKQGG